MRLEIPIEFTLKNGQKGIIMIDTGEIEVTKEGSPVRDYPPERLEQFKKEISIGALENAIMTPDYPPEVLEAIESTLQKLKAEYN